MKIIIRKDWKILKIVKRWINIFEKMFTSQNWNFKVWHEAHVQRWFSKSSKDTWQTRRVQQVGVGPVNSASLFGEPVACKRASMDKILFPLSSTAAEIHHGHAWVSWRASGKRLEMNRAHFNQPIKTCYGRESSVQPLNSRLKVMLYRL